MKIIDCEFHYYLPELMEYLSTRDNAMRYYPETKILEVRDKVFAHFDGVTNEYPVIDELMNFGAERIAVMDKNGIDTGVMAFDGGNFSVHLVFTTNFQSNTRKTFLAALVNAQNSNNKYTGFVFTVYQYYRIRIYALNNVTIGGNGYGGSNVYDFQFPTSYGNKVSKYVIDMTYTASTKTLSTVFKYGPNDGTSIENFQSLSESEAVSTFPSNLDGPTITLGGNGVVSTYNMNSMNVLEFSVTKS